MADWPAELEKITQFEVRVVEKPGAPLGDVKGRWNGNSQGESIGTRGGLQPSVCFNQPGGEVRFDRQQAKLCGRGWLEKSVAGRLVFEGVASQSRGVDSWWRVGTGNFLLEQARAR